LRRSLNLKLRFEALPGKAQPFRAAEPPGPQKSNIEIHRLRFRNSSRGLTASASATLRQES
jgi:hypothetical protein